MRCCPTCLVTWATRVSTAPTTTSTPRPTSWTPTPRSPRTARRCCPRWASDETRPRNRRPGLLQFRPRLPARLHAQGPGTVAEDDRGLPDQPGMLPGLPRRGRAHRTRARQLRPLRPPAPQSMAGLDDRAAALHAEDRRAAPERRQGVPGLRRPGG